MQILKSAEVPGDLAGWQVYVKYSASARLQNYINNYIQHLCSYRAISPVNI